MRIFKPRRHYRYQSLNYLGFYGFETADLSRVAFKVPYMDALIDDRQKLVARAKKGKWSDKRLREFVRNMYKRRGWIRTTRKGKRKWDAFRMVKYFERRYKEKHPEYESPGDKRRKDFVRYTSKVRKSFGFDRGEKKYPKGYPK